MKSTTIVLACGALGLAISSGLAADATVNTNEAPKKIRWDTSATLGATLTRGNSRTLLVSGNIQSTRKWDQNEINLGADAVYGENNNVKSSEAVHGFGQYNRLFTERAFGYFRLEGWHDAIADIDYRVSLAPGAGYYFIKKDRISLRGELGPGYVFEKVGSHANDYATLRVAERGDYKLNDRAKIWESVEFLPQVDNFDNYVINAELGLETAITKKLAQTMLIQDSYRNIPAAGHVKNDIRLIAGVTYKF